MSDTAIHTIYLDVDEVLADWKGGVFNLLGVDKSEVIARHPKDEWDVLTSIPGHSKSSAWRMIDEAGEGFWAELELSPHAIELYDLCRSLADVYLLTTPSFHHSSYSGKAKWIAKHFGSKFRNTIITSAKYKCAKPGALLIDDRPKNCFEFISSGGDAIAFPTFGNENSIHEKDPMPFIRTEISKRIDV